MLQADFYLMARHEARFHVRVEVLSVKPVEHTPGPMPLEARVVEVYRTDGTLKVGDRVTFAEYVTRAGDEIPDGGIRWKGHDEVMSARYLEAFLNGEPPACEVALSQSVVLSASTGGAQLQGWFPVVAVRQRALRACAEPPASRRRWWRFWE